MENLRPWQNLFQKASKNKEITLAFLGGSITQGAGASCEKNRWVNRVSDWMRNQYPEAEITTVNAGVGGTNSLFGAARMEEDILVEEPDLVFLDFSVNDHNDPLFMETMEAVIRKLLYRMPNPPAIIMLCNLRLDDLDNCEPVHLPLARAYDIPVVSMKEIWKKPLEEGTLTWQDLSEDALHPNDAGHAVIAFALKEKLASLRKTAENLPLVPEMPVKEPLSENNWENAWRMNARNSTPTLLGFQKDTHEKKEFTDFFSCGWMADKVGDALEISIPCSSLAIQYRKTIQGPSFKAQVWIDEEPAAVLDGNFQDGWGEALYMQPLLERSVKRERKIRIELIEGADDINNCVPFYLLSFAVA